MSYVPLGLSLDEAPPKAPAFETLVAELMNFVAIGVAAPRLERIATSNGTVSKDMRGENNLSGTGRLQPRTTVRAG
jgi:hypothetical protein